MGHWRGYEFRMTLRFQTKVARWMGTLSLPFIEAWVTEKEEWILIGKIT